ncbi:UTP--glucose-1-phosphate uridylyltransferase 3, chloroplastic, partial [Cucurbita argyrosperma subsp. sororia]
MAQARPVLHHNHHFPFSLTSKTLHFSLRFARPPLTLVSSQSPSSTSSSSLSSSSSFSSSRYVHLPRVSTAPVDYVPPAPEYDFEQEIVRLRGLCTKLSKRKSIKEKLKVIDRDYRVKQFFNSRRNWFCRVLPALNLDPYDCFLLKCLVAAGQEHVLSLGIESVEGEFETARGVVKHALFSLVEMIEKFDVNGNGGREGFGKGGMVLEKEELGDLKKLLTNLGEIEQFYDCIGGIIGYQIKVLELLASSKPERYSKNWSGQMKQAMDCEFLKIHAPNGPDLSQNIEYASQAALWGIEGLPELGEIYPLGGAADRLGLVDPDTGECLPAAMLSYCGRTLLEGLIRDLQAREFLYNKIYGKQCITPVAIMTSSAKNNHKRIVSLCERFGWFGRGRSNFQLFEQPLVPAIGADDGLWLVTKSFTPLCKPGGHGVIWKLAHDKGIFKWFYDHGRKGATVRQVSNVAAATDLTLLALSGIGLRKKKKLGFASCKRTTGATEGMNVLIERKNLDGMWEYGLSCIEYTEFEKYGITEGSHSPVSLQESFPANTNILYVDLHSVESVMSSNSEKSLPGMVLNLKKPVAYFDQFGRKHSVSGGRLECTMQNIADSFFNTSSSQCYNDVEDILDTFIVYNERRRVTSSAKRTRKHASESLHQTPDGALLDILRNAHDLLSRCNIEVPVVESNDMYVDSGPPYLILLHPALGPLWEVARQKFSGGSISKGSELQVEVAEFLWRNVQLDGSLIVLSENVMGSLKIDENGESLIRYGQRCGRCKLENVKVLNKGIDWNAEDNIYWKLEVQRHEGCKIILHGNAEFEATDVVLQGNHVFEVPDGYKLIIAPGTSGFEARLYPIELDKQDTGSWCWNYKIEGSHIKLEYVEQ